MKNLAIIDLEQNKKNYCIKRSNYIQLNHGEVNLISCNELKFSKEDLFKKKKKLLKNIILNFYNKFSLDTEIFNLRNDRDIIISKILIFLNLKSYVSKKKYQKIKLITDDANTLVMAKSIFKNIEYIDYSKKKNKKIFFYLIKFYLKIFFFLITIKIFPQKQTENKLSEIKDKNFFLSIYPNFFKGNKEKFYNKKNALINFIITDESHFNFTLIDLIKIYFKTKKEIFHIETLISFKSLIKSFFISLKYYFQYINFFKKKYLFESIDITVFIHQRLCTSITNRLKLELYVNPIRLLKKNLDIEKIHMYLFEYSFGFFITNQFKKNNVKVVGYQHGIFSKNLFFLDLLAILKKKEFLPDQIISNNFSSYKSYKKILGILVQTINYKPKKTSLLATNIKITENKKQNIKILYIAGTHDIESIYSHVKKKYLNNKNFKIFIKIHPKNRFEIKNKKNIYILKNINTKTFFNQVYISPTSTLKYDFDNLNIKYKIFQTSYKYC